MQRFAIGFDLVSVKRFERLLAYTDRQLLRIVSPDELAYVRAGGAQSAQRLAVRFAAREAFYKSLQSIYPERIFSFFAVCRAVQIMKTSRGAPVCSVAWELLVPLAEVVPGLHVLLSLTHEEDVAGAMVLVVGLGEKGA